MQRAAQNPELPAKVAARTRRFRQLAHRQRRAAWTLFFSIRHLLRMDPITIERQSHSITRVRVCEGFDYVVDAANHTIHGQPACPRNAPREAIKQLPRWNNVEVLKPLYRPAWISHVLLRPGDLPLPPARNGRARRMMPKARVIAQLTPRVLRLVHDALRLLPEFARLRALLAKAMVSLLGRSGLEVVDLAMRSRTSARNCTLVAYHLTRVWRNLPAYRRMAAENPHLLTALTAWLGSRPSLRLLVDDAVPLMREDLDERGFAPVAWRYLARHGADRLHLPGDLSWNKLCNQLRQLRIARWPAPPPRKFLHLMDDVVGAPMTYMEGNGADGGMPGWFWNWVCQAAHDARHDTRAYAALQNDVLQWSLLVRFFQITPDANQQRRRLHWLRSWAEEAQLDPRWQDGSSWGAWLGDLVWPRNEKLQAVPLLDVLAVREEARKLHNCADNYVPACLDGKVLLVSLRQRDSGERHALVGLRLSEHGTWKMWQIAGKRNCEVNEATRNLGRHVAKFVQAQYRQHRRAKAQQGQPMKEERRAA